MTTINACRAVVPNMLARDCAEHAVRGRIVNLASIIGFSGGITPNASYQASKGGVVNLTRALALEWAADNIRVNAVAPTYVRTDLTVPIFSNPEILKRVLATPPKPREASKVKGRESQSK